jgi:exopolyphosphatase/guanosine-5'-triphosphate,3'-diphosphate pyrophosphatase
MADAVDRSHLQKVAITDVALSGEELVITVAAEQDISLEEWTFIGKADFFENVFGIRPILARLGEAHGVR